MSNKLLLRIALIVISLVVGFVATWLTVLLILNTTLGDYGLDYVIYTWLSIALGVGILLDRFMGTEFLPK